MIKRTSDIVITTVALLLLAPLLLLTCILVKLTMSSPVFFKQLRAGEDGVPFRLYKFRSMNNMTDSNGNLLHDSERLTTIGKLFRKTSIDELLSLINVLKGEMSLVGPRPLLVPNVNKYVVGHFKKPHLKQATNVCVKFA